MTKKRETERGEREVFAIGIGWGGVGRWEGYLEMDSGEGMGVSNMVWLKLNYQLLNSVSHGYLA